MVFSKAGFSVGTHTITLTVTDNHGASANDDVVISVNNTPPIADAGPDQSLIVGDNARIDGLRSYDTNHGGSIVEYAWYLNGELISIEATISGSIEEAGVYVLTLVVTDNHGASVSDTMTVMVHSISGNGVVIANAGSDQNIYVGDVVTLDGSKSHSGSAAGGAVSFEWYNGSTLISTAASFTDNFSIGIHTLTLFVTNVIGESASDTVVVKVSAEFVRDIYFSDSALKACVDRMADENKWTLVTEFTRLVCNGEGVVDASGIEFLTHLETLQLTNNSLTTIDLRQQTALTSVTIYYNQLNSIYFGSSATIRSINLSDNQLSEIDLQDQTALTSLDLNGNRLSSIDLQYQTELTNLYMVNNQLISIDLQYQDKLKILNLNGNSLSVIDLQYQFVLTDLYLESNQLEHIDLQYQTALTSLKLGGNLFSEISLDQQTKLTYLDMVDNQLSSIDLNYNAELTTLYLRVNPLTGVTKAYLDSLEIPEIEY